MILCVILLQKDPIQISDGFFIRADEPHGVIIQTKSYYFFIICNKKKKIFVLIDYH